MKKNETQEDSKVDAMSEITNEEFDNLDDILTKISVGRYQMIIFLINFLIWTIYAPHSMGSTLYNAPVDFKCLTNEEISNCQIIRINQSTLYDSTCLEYVKPYEHETMEANCSFERGVKTGFPSCPIVIYDDEIFSETVTTNWNLICESSIKRPLFQNAYTFGNIIGCVLSGTIADRIGRARAILLGSIIHVTFSSLVVIVPIYWFMLGARLVVGISNLLILIPAVTHAIETCPVSWRGPVGMFVGVPYSLWVIVFAVFGYFIRRWDYLYMLSVFPGAIPLIPLAFFLKESPRWLIQNHKDESAHTVLLNAAKQNGCKPEVIQLINKRFNRQGDVTVACPEEDAFSDNQSTSSASLVQSPHEFEPISLAKRFSLAEGFHNSSRSISKCSFQFSELRLHALYADDFDSYLSNNASRYVSHSTKLDQIDETEELSKYKQYARCTFRVLKSIRDCLMLFIRTPFMRRISIIAPLARCFGELVYFGVLFNANNFSSENPFIYVGLSGLFDGLACLIGVWASKALSRRLTVGGGLLGSGVLLLIVLFVPLRFYVTRLLLVMTGFLMSAIASQGFYVYLPELFPTQLRARGFSFSNLMGNCGVLVAPIISDVVGKTVWWGSGVCLGISGLIAGFFVILLPETKDNKLCENIEEIEIRGMGHHTEPSEKTSI